MKINKFFKYLMIIFLSFICVLLVGCGDVDAVLQSNGNTAATYNLSDWMLNVRQMESLGGAMGLSESIGTDLMPTTESNNIDVHMQKNTEYGAMAILSASAYGNPNKIASGDTTTGNTTGVVMNLSNEWVSAGNNQIGAVNFRNSVNRYKNIYSTSYVAKSGDAIVETAGWHGASYHRWMDSDGNSGLVRSSLNIFSYYGVATGWSSDVWGYWSYKHNSRAVIVVGEDL